MTEFKPDKTDQFKIVFNTTDLDKQVSLNIVGETRLILFTIPNCTNGITATLKILTKDNEEIYTSGAKAENAAYKLSIKQLLTATERLRITLSGVHGDTIQTLTATVYYWKTD